MSKREYCFGIYYYLDNETGNIVYIGKDSHIDKETRRKAHIERYNYNSQQFNRVLQNNPSRYEYHEYCRVSSVKEMNQLEFDLINLYRPKFNYKHGGDSEKRFPQQFVYTIVKVGHCGFRINDINNKPIKSSKYKSNLIPFVDMLNNGDITESELRDMNLRRSRKEDNPLEFEYTVIKSGKNRFGIYNEENKAIKKSKDEDKLIVIANALNDNIITEKQVKSTWGADKVLELIILDGEDTNVQ